MNTKINYYTMPGLIIKNAKDIHRIALIVCDYLEIEHKQLISPKRYRNLVLARNMICAIVKHTSKMTYSEIGRYFHRDHSSIIHGVEMHNRDVVHDDNYAAQFLQISLLTKSPNQKQTDYVI